MGQMRWVAGHGVRHAVVAGDSLCGVPIDGGRDSGAPCATCVELLFDALYDATEDA